MSSISDNTINYTELEKLLLEEETNRHQHPCCFNCSNCYSEYGETFCKIHDYPLDDGNIAKCEDWV